MRQATRRDRQQLRVALTNVFVLTILLAIMVAVVSSVRAGETITVELTSGRSFTGAVDARTDDERLWLRFGSHGTTLIRPIAWERIERAEHSGQWMAGDELRALAENLKLAADASKPVAAENVPTIPSAPEVNAVPATEAVQKSVPIARQAQAALGATPRVQSVQFDVYLANWDADVEADGLIVNVYPLDANGMLTPVSGVLEVDLTARRRRASRHLPVDGRQSTAQVARWSKPLWAEDAGPTGLVAKLPFQALHPEFDVDVGSYGLVHVRLTIPGHGVFEHSEDAVRIRPFAPLRDELQRSGSQRFLPTEQTGRGQRLGYTAREH
jgi:hypothetical protein